MSRTTILILGLVAPIVSSLGLPVDANDLLPRQLPGNAVQPPGASFEKHISRGQKRLLVRDLIHQSLAEAAQQPIKSTLVGAYRFVERLGVHVAEAIPVLPLPPLQSPEAGGPCTSARLTPLFDSEPAYRALLELISSARCRIDLMIFGWDDDAAGRPVAAALIERARSGVLVRLMIDRGAYVTGEGNAKVAQNCPTYLDDLKREPNIRVIETPDAFFRFDHRKVAVIDDRVVWTGGMILTAPALRRWHNFAFLAEGAIVPQYAALFAQRWAELGGVSVLPCDSSTATALAIPNAAVRMVRTDIGHRSLKKAVYGAVDHAKYHIYIENPYFSDEILVKKLAAARARGVEVHAILTLRGDVKLMNRLSTVTANHLLRAGVRVYLYPAMTHVKAMSVDGTLAYIGTGNFDDLSLRNNREVALTVRGPELIRQIDAGLFLQDMAVSEEIHALLPLPKAWWLLEASSPWY